MKIEVSNGEILDKHTILKIKLELIKDEAKLKNIQKEYDILDQNVKMIFNDCEKEDELHLAYNSLLTINRKLWKIEDDIRDCERERDFSLRFIQLARDVYYTNDDRNLAKKKIDSLTGSALTEEKGYSDYKNKP